MEISTYKLKGDHKSMNCNTIRWLLVRIICTKIIDLVLDHIFDDSVAIIR